MTVTIWLKNNLTEIDTGRPISLYDYTSAWREGRDGKGGRKEHKQHVTFWDLGEDLLQFFFSNVEGTPFSYINKKPNSIKIVRIRKWNCTLKVVVLVCRRWREVWGIVLKMRIFVPKFPISNHDRRQARDQDFGADWGLWYTLETRTWSQRYM